MFSPDDTIVAIATPPGRGGIGVVRISGPVSVRRRGAAFSMRDAPARAARTRPSPAHARSTKSSRPTFPRRIPTPAQHVVEISAHGSPVVLHAIVGARSRRARGSREPGEFTLRAFLNGKRDLIQAEAVADLIAAVDTAAGARRLRSARRHADQTHRRRSTRSSFDLIARLEASLDFPDEGYHFIEASETAFAIDRVIGCARSLLGDARRGPHDSRGRDGGNRGQAKRR